MPCTCCGTSRTGGIRRSLSIAKQLGVKIGAINPNLFQDQCYKFGSLANPDPEVRQRAVQHCLDSIELGSKAGSTALSCGWLTAPTTPARAISAPASAISRNASQQIHEALPDEMTMLVEYKPFEPAFYHTDIADWGMAYLFARDAGQQAKVLVDTGHHYTVQNIEQIVAWLIDENMLGGFHFNDRKYADDDLTFASIDPYAAFRVFHEIVSAQQSNLPVDIAYMVDQSHNLKPKIEAMIQTVTMIHELFAKALLVDRKKLAGRSWRAISLRPRRVCGTRSLPMSGRWSAMPGSRWAWRRTPCRPTSTAAIPPRLPSSGRPGMVPRLVVGRMHKMSVVSGPLSVVVQRRGRDGRA